MGSFIMGGILGWGGWIGIEWFLGVWDGVVA